MLKCINREDKKKITFFILFKYIPYLFIFNYKNNTKLFIQFNKINFTLIYNGKFWQKINFSKWKLGLNLFYFIWSKQVAIYKKKQYLKKKKK